MQRVSSQARAADLHSSDIQAELRHQQELVEERDAEIRRLQKVTCLFVIQLALCILPCPACSFLLNPSCVSFAAQPLYYSCSAQTQTHCYPM